MIAVTLTSQRIKTMTFSRSWVEEQGGLPYIQKRMRWSADDDNDNSPVLRFGYRVVMAQLVSVVPDPKEPEKFVIARAIITETRKEDFDGSLRR